jgi:hypothetical protein
MNIINQTAGSIGTATMSVVLTNLLNNQPLARPAIASNFDPTIAQKVPPGAIQEGLDQAATAFSHTYIVALVLIIATLIPAFFLPRTKPKTLVVADAPAAVVH